MHVMQQGGGRYGVSLIEEDDKAIKKIYNAEA